MYLLIFVSNSWRPENGVAVSGQEIYDNAYTTMPLKLMSTVEVAADIQACIELGWDFYTFVWYRNSRFFVYWN
jgi:hypothetical protein